MKKLLVVAVITVVCCLVFYSCSLDEISDDNNTLRNWDLYATGCEENWDKDLKGNTNYNLGIIDFHTTVFSDSQNKVYHDELIIKLAKKIAPNCLIQAKILSEDATSDDINAAIELLHKSGCHIINMSIGQSNPIQFSSYVLEMIENDTLVLVCATGNQNKGILFPAAGDNVVSVYAKDINGGIAKAALNEETKQSFSAPGYHIYIDGDYYSGSSLATVYTAVAFSAIYAREQASTVELIDIAMSKAINSISPNDLGIIQIASE